MKKILGIRKEDKNIWERRVPLTPKHVAKIVKDLGIPTIVQPFKERTFADDEFMQAGATLSNDLNAADVIVAVKEVPIELLIPNKTYLFFSHTIKGQEYNMPLLKKLMELKCTLIDYEAIKNSKGQRLVFFGKFAGLAGMIDTFNGLGNRFKSLGIDTPFSSIKQAYQYSSLEEAKEAIAKVADKINSDGLPKEISPLKFGFAGYGNVSKGAQEIFDLLPFQEVLPSELNTNNYNDNNLVYKTVFKEVDMFERKDGNDFGLLDYFENPENYKSKFHTYLKNIDVLVNAIFWHDKCPKLITKNFVKQNFESIKLKFITDITCDIDGAIELTYKATEPDMPAFVYNPKNDSFIDGFEGEGIVDLTIDNLPTELPKNSSIEFGNALFPFIEGLMNADTEKVLEQANYPEEIKNAVVVYKGELTKNFEYLKEYIK